MKEQNWEFKDNCIANEEKNQRIEIYKEIDKDTGEHTLLILGIECGIDISYDIRHELDIMKLDTSIYKLRKFGLLLNKIDAIEIAKVVDDNYYKIQTKGKSELYYNKDRFKAMLDYIYEYIEINKIPLNKKGYYGIGVVEFGDIFKEATDFTKVDVLKLRKQLKANNITRCVKDRTDTLICDVNGDRIRGLSIIDKKVNKYYKQEITNAIKLKLPSEPVEPVKVIKQSA